MLVFLICLIGIPALSLFIQKTYESGMIFRRVYLYFVYHYMKNWRKKDRYKRWFYKPFLCCYCYNTWISIFFYFMFISHNILLLPLFIGLTYIILEILIKSLNLLKS